MLAGLEENPARVYSNTNLEIIVMSYVTFEDRENVRIIVIDRQEALNALNESVLLQIETAIDAFASESSLRVGIITGAGERSFVAGADIAEMRSMSTVSAENFSKLGHRVFNKISACKKPVIAAVNGFAFGGGLELALACDFIFASENARLGLVETRLGLIPGFGGIARLSRLVGQAKAAEMIFSGAQIDAEEAKAIGLVNRVTKPLEVVEEACRMAKEIAKRGPYAVSVVKKLIFEGKDVDLRTANSMEQKSFGLIFSRPEHEEGIKAFLEKRTPSFVDP